MSEPERDKPHVPAPSLWPIGFAIGIACVLVGLVVSVPALIVGALIALVFGFLWVRDLFAHSTRSRLRRERRADARRSPTGRATSTRTSTAPRSSRSRRSASAA